MSTFKHNKQFGEAGDSGCGTVLTALLVIVAVVGCAFGVRRCNSEKKILDVEIVHPKGIDLTPVQIRSVENIGIKWADDGVFSVEAADAKIRQANISNQNYSIVKTAFGLNNPGSPTAKQLEFCNRWITEWKFSSEMLREAYERCVDTKGVMRFSYIDGILKRWHNAGVMNLNDLAELDSDKKKKSGTQKRKTSYNIDEIKKIDTLDFID